jgi:hypothetical protein
MATQTDNTNTGVVATIVVVGSFAMIAVSALLYAMVRSEEAEVDAERPIYADLDTIASLDRQQEAALNAPARWVDKEKGKVGLPISRAMKLTLDDYRKDPAKASPPIPPGLVLPPMPGADGAAGAGGAGAVPAAAGGAAGIAAPAPGGAPVAGGAPAPGGAPGGTPVVDSLVGGKPGAPATNTPAAPPSAAPVSAPGTPALPAPGGGSKPGAAPAPPKTGVAPTSPKPAVAPATGGAPATGAAPATGTPATGTPATGTPPTGPTQPAAPATGK